MCTTERGLLIPFAREPNWKNFSRLEKVSPWEEHVGTLRKSKCHTRVHSSVCVKSRERGPLVLYCVFCSAADGRPVRFMWAGPVWSLLFISSRLVLPPGVTQSFFHMLLQWRCCQVRYCSLWGFRLPYFKERSFQILHNSLIAINWIVWSAAFSCCSGRLRSFWNRIRLDRDGIEWRFIIKMTFLSFNHLFIWKKKNCCTRLVVIFPTS